MIILERNFQKEFLDLVESIEREGMNTELLIRQLNSSDFFTAPASTKYHGSREQGLVEHSIDVYRNIVALNDLYECGYDDNTLKIVALFHDMSKMNYYVADVRNKKIYSEAGKKTDGLGKYDWVSFPGYAIREPEDRFIFGNHESTAAYMISTFIPLTTEEYVAISHHHGGMGWDSSKENISDIWNKYPLSLLLFQADLSSAYMTCK